jgi:murein endopeptidase
VTIARMRDQWNKGEETLQLGARIVVFRIPEPAPQVPPAAEPMAILPSVVPATAPAAALAATIVKPQVVVAPVVPPVVGSHSTGAADRGRILNATQIPANPALYTIRKPEHSYGSSHAIKHLTLAIQRFRTTGFDREIVIQDMSRKGGGRFRPHESHQSGRDVDIRLPLKQGVALGTIPESLSLVDWDATWALMRELLATNEVRFIFLSRNRQKPLYEAALRAGANKDELATLLQFPRTSRTAVIRHARGHVKHFHVRFKCSPEERSCLDPGF